MLALDLGFDAESVAIDRIRPRGSHFLGVTPRDREWEATRNHERVSRGVEFHLLRLWIEKYVQHFWSLQLIQWEGFRLEI